MLYILVKNISFVKMVVIKKGLKKAFKMGLAPYREWR